MFWCVLKMVVAKNTYVFGFVMANWFQLIGTIFLQVQCYIKYWWVFDEMESSLLLFISDQLLVAINHHFVLII